MKQLILISILISSLLLINKYSHSSTAIAPTSTKKHNTENKLQKLEEIGIELENKTIMNVFNNSPAEKAGIEVGDIVLGINFNNTTNNTYSNAALLKKFYKQLLILFIERGDKKLLVFVIREELLK